MTDIRVGDIVEIEHGNRGEPGHSIKTVRVVQGHPRNNEVNLAALAESQFEEGADTVRVVERQRLLTGLYLIGGDWNPAIVHGVGVSVAKLTNGTIVEFSRETLDESFVETCPYVPRELIDEAEAWENGMGRWAEEILSDIVDSVRHYRDEDSL